MNASLKMDHPSRPPVLSPEQPQPEYLPRKLRAKTMQNRYGASCERGRRDERTANRHFTTILSADVPQRKGPRKANLDERLDTYRARRLHFTRCIRRRAI